MMFSAFLALCPLSIYFPWCVWCCREVVASLIEEYKACESPNYINWGVGGGAAGAEAAGAAAAAQGGEGKEAT